MTIEPRSSANLSSCKGPAVSIFKKIFGKKVWEELADEGEFDMDAAMSAAWEAPAPRSVVAETVIDAILPNDTAMPEELRGCQVVERKFSDGTTGIYYIGDGICADENQASVLIEAHRQSLTKAPRANPFRAGPPVGGGFAHAPAGAGGAIRFSQVSPWSTGAGGGMPQGQAAAPVPPVQQGRVVQPAPPGLPQAPVPMSPPQQMQGTSSQKVQAPAPQEINGGSSRQQTVSSGFDVLDELPDDETVPKALRAALVVRKSDGVYYLTREAKFVPKAEAEEWLDLWEKAHRTEAPPIPWAVSKPAQEPTEEAQVTFTETTPARPHRHLPQDALGQDSSPGPSPEITPQVLRAPDGQGGVPDGGAGASLVAPKLELDGRPVVAKGWGFRSSGREQDPWQKALEQAGLAENAEPSGRFGGDLGDSLPTIPQVRPDQIIEERSVPEEEVRPKTGRPSETPTDRLRPPPDLLSAGKKPSPEELGPAFRKVLRLVEAIRQDALEGNWAPVLDDVAEDVIREVCDLEIGKPWSDDRVERMVADSVTGHSVLVASAAAGLDRNLRRELESGTKVVLVANPARVGDVDMELVATLARLRAVGAKRAVVVRDLARLFETVTCSDLGNYLMTRSFVEEFSLRLSEDPEAAVGKTIKVSALRRLMGELLSRRAAISLRDVLAQVEQRHAVRLEFLRPVLIEALDPVFKSVSDELVSRLKSRKKHS